jgi:hypothetical protein
MEMLAVKTVAHTSPAAVAVRDQQVAQGVLVLVVVGVIIHNLLLMDHPLVSLLEVEVAALQELDQAVLAVAVMVLLAKALVLPQLQTRVVEAVELTKLTARLLWLAALVVLVL